MMTFFVTRTITFSEESVDPDGIGGGRKEHNINNQAIFRSLLA